MAEFRLATDRLILRDWGEGDWPEFFRLTNTPAVMQWLGGVFSPEGMESQRRRIEACRKEYGHCFWLVERKADGGHLASEILGFCGIKRADAPASTVPGEFEIGWRLREDAWGHGYAKQAAQASLAAGFRIFGARQIVALTVIENSPSWGLMKCLGMRRREELDYADLRSEAPFRDTIVYSIDRAEWEKA